MTEKRPEAKPPQVIRDSHGRPAFAVVPWDTWTAMQDALEDARDAALLDRLRADLAAGREELVPMELADSIAVGDSPIKVWRRHRGLTQKDLAAATGLNQAYISELESGAKPNPSIDTLRRLARELGVSLEDLLRPETAAREFAEEQSPLASGRAASPPVTKSKTRPKGRSST